MTESALPDIVDVAAANPAVGRHCDGVALMDALKTGYMCLSNPRTDRGPWEPWEGNGPCQDCGARNIVTVDFTGDTPNPAALAICLDCPLAKTCRDLAQHDRHATGVYGATWIVNGKTREVGRRCRSCGSPFFTPIWRSGLYCRPECWTRVAA